MLPKLEMSLKQKVGRRTSNQREVCEVAGSGCLIKEKWITLAGGKKKKTQQVQYFNRQAHQVRAVAQTQEDVRGDSSGLHSRPGSEGSTSKMCACSSYTSSERSLRCARYKPGTRGTA